MPKITTPLLTEDFYRTTLTGNIAATGDIILNVTTPPANKKGFIIVDPESVANREKMYYNNVIGNDIYVKGVNRVNPKAHLAQDKVQINDTSLVFNYLSRLNSTTFFVEQTGLLTINVLGGPVLLGINTISVADTPLTMTNGVVNYIYYKSLTNTVKTTTVEATATTDKGIIVAEITTVGGAISKIDYRQHKLFAGISIDTIVKTNTTVLVDTYTITYSDGNTSTFTVTNGRGINTVIKTGTVGLVDTYTITYNDTTTSTFTVTNGRGINTIVLTNTSADGLTHTYTITYNDATTSTYTVVDGNGITSIIKTGTVGLVDTYTITFQDTTTSTFTVTNGLDGKNVLNGIINPTTEGVDGDFYINTVSNNIYGPKTAGVWGVGTSLIGPTGPATSWGLISGTLANQTDIQTALNGKEASLGNPTTDGDILSSTIAGVRSWITPNALYSASSTGNDSYAITIPNLTAYADGEVFRFKADVANIGPATLNVNGLGAIALKKQQGTVDLVDNDIQANGIVTAVYNSTGPVFQFTGQNAIITTVTGSNLQTSVNIGETITALKAIVFDGTGYKLSDASDINLIDFKGFSNTSANINNPVNLVTNGVLGGFTGLTQGDYFLANKIGIPTYTPGTPISKTGVIDSAIGYGYNVFGSVGNTHYVGQNFTMGIDNVLTGINCSLYKIGNPTDSITCSLYSTAGGSYIATATNTIPASALTNAYSNQLFTFNNIVLTNGISYFIDIRRTGALNDTNKYMWGVISNPGTGKSWQYYTSRIQNTTYNRYHTINTASISYTYTYGHISHIPGTNSVKIGNYFSPTKLKIINN